MEPDDRTHSARPPGPSRPDSEPAHHDAALSGMRQRARGIERDLTDVYYRMLEHRKAAVGERFPSKATTLKLTIHVVPPGSVDSQAKGEQVFHQIQEAVERCVEESSAFPLGRVHCHWCGSCSCEHSFPPDPRSVFRGYSATGQPLWQEFMSFLLERKHPRVDAIFRDEPLPVAIVQGGHELSSEQLPVYGKRSAAFRILGQVTVGYIPFPDGFCLPLRAGGQRHPLAITFQAVETGTGRRAPILNILGTLPDGSPTFQALEESPDARLADAIRSTRRSLDELTLMGTSRRKRSEKWHRVFAVLGRLARNLERIFRQRHRRTQHAQDRHQNRNRPAAVALRDALHATAESIYRDVEEQTWVVVGPKNRVHVFNDQARHVTSVTYPGDTIRQRTTRGKWRAPRPDDLAAFKDALSRRAEPD